MMGPDELESLNIALDIKDEIEKAKYEKMFGGKK